MTKNHWKMFEINIKCWKRPQKSVSTSFLVCAAHKTWSLYTTVAHFFNQSQSFFWETRSCACFEDDRILKIKLHAFTAALNNLWTKNVNISTNNSTPLRNSKKTRYSGIIRGRTSQPIGGCNSTRVIIDLALRNLAFTIRALCLAD